MIDDHYILLDVDQLVNLSGHPYPLLQTSVKLKTNLVFYLFFEQIFDSV